MRRFAQFRRVLVIGVRARKLLGAGDPARPPRQSHSGRRLLKGIRQRPVISLRNGDALRFCGHLTEPQTTAAAGNCTKHPDKKASARNCSRRRRIAGSRSQVTSTRTQLPYALCYYRCRPVHTNAECLLTDLCEGCLLVFRATAGPARTPLVRRSGNLCRLPAHVLQSFEFRVRAAGRSRSSVNFVTECGEL